MISKETKLEEFDEKIFIFNRTNSRAKSIRDQMYRFFSAFFLIERRKRRKKNRIL